MIATTTKSLAQFKALLFGLMLVIAVSACSKKDSSPTQMLAGSSSKAWKIDRERTASGEKDKVTSAESKERVTFYTNGTFNMSSPTQTMSGNWTYDASSQSLSMQQSGAESAMSFKVTKLEDNNMTWQAGDGSTMELEAD